jgi:hypothetical protein
VANGSVYRRDDRKKPWIAHISWQSDAHRHQKSVAPIVIRLRDFFVTVSDSREIASRGRTGPLKLTRSRHFPGRGGSRRELGVPAEPELRR